MANVLFRAKRRAGRSLAVSKRKRWDQLRLSLETKNGAEVAQVLLPREVFAAVMGSQRDKLRNMALLGPPRSTLQ